jgi:hypothetical protein
MKYALDMASWDMIHIPSFMKVGRGVQAILKYYLGNLRGCKVGITDGKFPNYTVEME